MEDKDRGGKQDQLEDHSLPGTNQAGKGPDSCDETDQKSRADSASQYQTRLEKHSLPGTNQAGKGPASDQKDHG